MSVRIGNGRIVHASLSRTYELLMEARTESVALGEQQQHAWMARHAAGLIDKGDMADKDKPAHPIAEAWNSLTDAQRGIRSTQRRNPDCDFEFELWIFPVSTRRTLIMVHAERPEFADWFDALTFVSNHGYWDSVDRPDTVSEAAWNRRRQDWERAMPNGIPSERCLTLVMFNDQYPSMPTGVQALGHIPGRAQRALPIARGLHIDQVHAGLLATRREADPEFHPDGFAMLFEAMAMADAEEGRRAVLVADVTARLRDIAAGDLAPAF